MKFPRDFSKIVGDRWDRLIGGDYIAPKCPKPFLLRSLLETCFLASCVAEEGRYPSFNIVAFEKSSVVEESDGSTTYKFDKPRPFNVDEIRRLAPVVSLKKSAICCVWEETVWQIYGLVDLGTSWHRARVGLAYRYFHPKGLLLQIDRPGRLRVYQGAYHVATLADGFIEGADGIPMHLFLHEPANLGLSRMRHRMHYPAYEDEREFSDFEFIAIWNTYAAIANSISLSGHGGALIICSSGSRAC